MRALSAVENLSVGDHKYSMRKYAPASMPMPIICAATTKRIELVGLQLAASLWGEDM
ncbi:hypothetical protein BJX63DRAFT_392287 [Aspergillus granulosus]|uniref:Uncharacterized protein n=1 Tax=Aspergillus granulosus TaxID=176169 RepID=A0ABR4HG47_9EURO